jgi:hypothetical protein
MEVFMKALKVWRVTPIAVQLLCLVLLSGKVFM